MLDDGGSRCLSANPVPDLIAGSLSPGGSKSMCRKRGAAAPGTSYTHQWSLVRGLYTVEATQPCTTHEPPEWHILKIDPKTGDAIGKPQILSLEDSMTVAAFREGRPGYIAAYLQVIAFMDEETDKFEILKEIIPTKDRDIRRFNDGACDCMGRFWLAEIDRKALAAGWQKSPLNEKRIGRVWRYDPDGSLHQMEEGLMCGNGFAWSPDNETSE